MSKTLGTKTAIITDQSISANSAWTQSSSYISVSTITGYISLELQAKGTSTTLSGDIILYICPSLDGSVFPSVAEAIPLAVITNPGTSYVIEITAFDVTPYSSIAFYIKNTDSSNAATVSLNYRTSGL